MIQYVEQEAREMGLNGVCVLTSKGGWMANQQIFLNNGYKNVDQKDRFELLVKNWEDEKLNPAFIDWQNSQALYNGWNLLYSDQCPWHEKCVNVLIKMAREYDIVLKVHRIKSAEEARESPSGYGVFALLHDNKLVADHYISGTRFRNILKKELRLSQ